MKQLLQDLIFGQRAKGEKLSKPTLRTTNVTNRPSENDWAREFKVGNRYGHRGSFYQNNFRVTVA